jgi:hypothetical protein
VEIISPIITDYVANCGRTTHAAVRSMISAIRGPAHRSIWATERTTLRYFRGPVTT